MKKYIVFVVSFFVFYSILQIVSGLLLTATYTPNLSNAWKSVGTTSQTEIIGNTPFFMPFLLAFLSATVAYFVANRFVKRASF